MAGRRTAINKAKRDGITDVLTTFKEAPFSVQTQIREISAQWAGKKARRKWDSPWAASTN